MRQKKRYLGGPHPMKQTENKAFPMIGKVAVKYGLCAIGIKASIDPFIFKRNLHKQVSKYLFACPNLHLQTARIGVYPALGG
jgi:hypothetical protein